jgi:hypothetical protein
MRLISVLLNFPTVGFWLVIFSRLGIFKITNATTFNIFVSVVSIWLILSCMSLFYWSVLGKWNIGCLTAIPWLTAAGVLAIVFPVGYSGHTYTLSFTSYYHLIVVGAVFGILRWPDYLIFKNIRVAAN